MQDAKCPFCGSPDDADAVDTPETTFEGTRHVWAVRCSNCGAVGPWTTAGPDSAWAEWNGRTP